MGRGTTSLEAALLGRVPLRQRHQPLSVVLTRPRLRPPSLEEVAQRLAANRFRRGRRIPRGPAGLLPPGNAPRDRVAQEVSARARGPPSALDAVDDWICLLALNRLTGHSPGFFSVYTLPPNQAVSVKSQRKINAKRNQTPPPRDVPTLILKKTAQSAARLRRRHARKSWPALRARSRPADPARRDARRRFPPNSVSLVVTSPPFLDVVDYADRQLAALLVPGHRRRSP